MKNCCDLIGIKMETSTLPEILQEKCELNTQITQLMENANNLKPTDKQIEDYIVKHGFKRVTGSFEKADLSKLETPTGTTSPAFFSLPLIP